MNVAPSAATPRLGDPMIFNHSTQKVFPPRAPRAVVLLRTAIAFVFITEGIQKFLDPEVFGVGRFMKIGIPSPEIMGPFVGVAEITCGALVLIGLLTRLASFVLVIDMIVAIAATKIPILIGQGFWGFADPKAQAGFWSMAHESRLDIAMLLGCLFLMSAGPGPTSIDERMVPRLP
jgi:putative oxidoreductase